MAKSLPQIALVVLATVAVAAETGPAVGALLPGFESVIRAKGAIVEFFRVEELPQAGDFGVGFATVSKPTDGITQPGIIVLDSAGRVKAKYFDAHYTAAAVLAHIAPWSPAGEAHSGRHIDLTSSASNMQVLPGDRIALILDASLKPGMHVYAPGAEGYIPISWTLNGSTAYTAHAVEMPAPRILYLAAIDEKAPVFEGRFRLIRDVTVARSQPAGDLTIEGELKYQACDDRMCYLPETVPLNWTLRVEKHDNGASAYGGGRGHP
jgi:hypothetical protein